MRALSTRWLASQALVDGVTMNLLTALDGGDYSVADLVVTVEQAATGEAPELVFQHAARNGPDDYLNFSPPQTVDLTVSGKTWIRLDSFTRFLGWTLTGRLATSAIVSVDIVARQR